MFDQIDNLYEDAYKKLKNEICSMAGRILTDMNAVHRSDYIGKTRALSEVFDIMNKVDDEIYAALLREVVKEKKEEKEKQEEKENV